MADKKLRIGFIGMGGIARHHAKYLVDMDDVEVVACSDVSDDNLAQAKEQFGIAKHYKDWKEMLAQEELDAVDVCTPNGLHAPASIDALNAGCHVLVEKPLANNAEEGQAMLDAAKANGKHLVIAFQWRFHKVTQMFKRNVEEGRFGKIMLMRCHALRRRGIPNWGVFGRKELQGGGPLIDIGVHMMEMAHYVMGAPRPIAASGNIWTYMGDQPCNAACPWPDWDHETYTVEDLAVGQIRFDNGAIMTIESSFAAHCENSMGWTFMGEKGGGSFDPVKLRYDENGYMVDAEPAFLPEVDGFAIKMRKFVDTALHDKPSDSPAEHGLMIQKMIDGIYRSAESGQEVALD